MKTMNSEVLRMYLYMLKHKDKVIRTDWIRAHTLRVCITTSDMEPFDVKDLVFIYLKAK